ncbi:MAG: pyridoxal-phosphate dependent enzyme [Candidatus Cloacimonetes bacterium]|nr:pyridoxal-phosphate dependent enzyme [Candidatus Cloacimonadota bacterium]
MTVNEKQVLQNTVKRCREKGIIIPTYKQMRDPSLVPGKIKNQLKNIGLWDVNPLNLFRITWKNEPVTSGGSYSEVNYMSLPSSLTGIPCTIYVLVGKYFPTGSHKVGATFGPLVEKLVTGRFDPTTQKALWPSTGNYCRGGAFNSTLLGCDAIAVLPEEMSQERFSWLENIGAEVFATPGCESNVKEIYDKAKELLAERGNTIVNMNQFEQFGNAIWHYAVTGPAMEEVFNNERQDRQRFAGLFLTQGSAGTLGAAEYLKTLYPDMKLSVGEALQCPTLLYNGYGGHRIEGIGDKHVPWIHNTKTMDLVAGIDDNVVISTMRLFNEPAGHAHLKNMGIDNSLIEQLHLLGISSIANIIGAIKMAKYYEMTADDVIFTVATDSMELYGSRVIEYRKLQGEYTATQAAVDFNGKFLNLGIDYQIEPTYYEKRRMHNLKYFTWIEQQGKTVEELDAQWYDRDYWHNTFSQVDEWDSLIEAFNRQTGLLTQ